MPLHKTSRGAAIQSIYLAIDIWDAGTGHARPLGWKVRLAIKNIARRWQGRIAAHELIEIARSLRGRFTPETFRDELRRIGKTRPRVSPSEIRVRALRRAIRAERKAREIPPPS